MANLNKSKKYHFIYKTTNLKNGKFYVGMHSTNNLNDGYLGSGKRLKRSIKKYGKENFKIEYLEFFDSRELLVEREKQLVNDDLLKDDTCMNLMNGGGGGFISTENQRIRSIAGGNVHKFRLQYDIEYKIKHIQIFSKIREKWINSGNHNFKTFLGKTHTEETKKKIGEANSKKQKGIGNSQFGTKWITNGTENKKIKKEETIPIGWKAGRCIKETIIC
jgi:hypothetical protein